MVRRNQYAVFNLKSITSHLKMKGTMARGQSASFSSGVWLRVNEWIGMRYCVRSGLLSVFWLIGFCLAQYVYVCVCVWLFACAHRQEEATLAMCTRGSDERSQDVICWNRISANNRSQTFILFCIFWIQVYWCMKIKMWENGAKGIFPPNTFSLVNSHLN